VELEFYDGRAALQHQHAEMDEGGHRYPRQQLHAAGQDQRADDGARPLTECPAGSTALAQRSVCCLLQPVVSGQPSQQIDVSEDYFQLIIIDCGDANITYFLRVIVDFHTPPAPPPPPPQSCAATEEQVRSSPPLPQATKPNRDISSPELLPPFAHLGPCYAVHRQLCGSSKAASMSACRRCLAEENATLTKVKCTAATYTAFCQGAPPSEPRTCPKLDSPALHAALPTTVVPSDATFLWANATCDDGYHINDGSIHL
jgi:hypothetical protein